MDKATFRAWLGSELATQQLKAAVEKGRKEDQKLCRVCDNMGYIGCFCGQAFRQLPIEEDRETCTFCDEPMAADGSDHAGGDYGFDMVICRECFRESIVND
jgi:hypothetical protein